MKKTAAITIVVIALVAVAYGATWILQRQINADVTSISTSAGNLTVYVTDSANITLPNAAISVVDANGKTVAITPKSVSDGGLVISLPEGNYTFTASVTGYQTASQEATILDSTKTLNIPLLPN